MKVADEAWIICRKKPGDFSCQASSFSPGVEDSHNAEGVVAWLPVDCKIIPAADIIEQDRVRRTADGRQVDLHLDTADALQLAGVDEPFGTFAVAFQKIAAPAHPDQVPEPVCGGDDTAAVPADLCRFSIAKRTCDDLNGHIVAPYIFKELRSGHRFHRGNMPAHSRCPDTERANIGTNVKDKVAGPDIIEPVLGHCGYLPIWCIGSRENGFRFCWRENAGRHPEPPSTGQSFCMINILRAKQAAVFPPAIWSFYIAGAGTC